MSGPHHFVGRKAELDRWEEVLRNPAGQAVLVTGQQGMGKSMLAQKMGDVARAQPACGCVYYLVQDDYTPEAVMALMLRDAFEAAQTEHKLRDDPERRATLWTGLIKLVGGGGLEDIVAAFVPVPERNTRELFRERLTFISQRMPADGRAVFIVDSDKYLHPNSEGAWRNLTVNLPDKLKFIFAQRSDDVLVRSRDIRALSNVVCIPETALPELGEEAVYQLIDLRRTELAPDEEQLRQTLSRYRGHPYAVQGAIDLIADGLALDDLPADPTKEQIAAAQWERISERSPEAIRLFKAYAVLEVPVPDEVVQAVSELDADTVQHLRADHYLGPLLSEQDGCRRIYHSLLSEHILAQMSEQEGEPYHRRAIDVYRKRLNADVKPDALAARRLAEHVLPVDGQNAFVNVFNDECGKALIDLGLLEDAQESFRRALEMVAGDSVEAASILGNLALIYLTRGDLDRAEQMHRKALEIDEKLGRLEGMASDYGNLGLIYLTRGDLDRAEQMHRKALRIDEKLGRLEGMANAVWQPRADLPDARRSGPGGADAPQGLGDRREARAP